MQTRGLDIVFSARSRVICEECLGCLPYLHRVDNGGVLECLVSRKAHIPSTKNLSQNHTAQEEHWCCHTRGQRSSGFLRSCIAIIDSRLE